MAPRDLPCCTGPVSRESTQPNATGATFRQLAQDSHRLWSTLEFRHANPDRGTVHAWLRRPYDLRVEAGDGTIFVENQRPGTPGAGWQMSFSVPGDETLAQQAEDDPMYENYEWVAMLRPHELGRGEWHDQGPNDGNDNTAVDAAMPAPGVVIHHVWADDRHGRDTLWAEVSLDPRSYEPQCGCCPLLFNAATEAMEYGDNPRPSQRKGDTFTHSTRFEIALDVQTGVCASA